MNNVNKLNLIKAKFRQPHPGRERFRTMIKTACHRFLLLILYGFLMSGYVLALPEIMPLSDVKPGMAGKGRTVFSGTEREEFEVEILGVVENVQPKRNIILARLRGRNLENTGVISGMSGSPVYIGGRLVGAIAYAFAYAKEAITGITPIEEMLSLGQFPAPQRSAAAGMLSVKTALSTDDLLELFQKDSSQSLSFRVSGQVITPLPIPLYFSGFSPWVFEKAKNFFSPLGFQPLLGGLGGQLKPGERVNVESLREGDAVGVQLISGDLDLSAVGTVTYVSGSQVLAFGHPFYNLGSVDYAMTRANVIAILPSLQSSSKLAATGPTIGRISQDRTAGVLGELGKLPRLIPVNIKLMTGPTTASEFKLKLVSDKLLTPALINLAISSLVTGEQRSYGNLSLDFDGTVFLDQGVSIRLEDLFSGNYDNAATSLSNLVAAVVYYLINNEFREAGLYRIDLNVRAIEEVRFCSLEKVLLDKYEVVPGESIQIKVYYRTFREESQIEEVTLLAPPLPAGTEFQIIVGDVATMQQVERSQYRIQDFMPRSFSQLVRILSNLRKNNRIYFKVVAPKPGIFLRGEEMPNLPPTLKNMFTSPRVSSSPVDLSRSTLSEYQLQIPYVFRGGTVIPVKIKN